MFLEKCDKDLRVDLNVMSTTRFTEERYVLRGASTASALDLAVSEGLDLGVIASRRTDLL